jgi:hypothetical protein
VGPSPKTYSHASSGRDQFLNSLDETSIGKDLIKILGLRLSRVLFAKVLI